MSYIQLFIQFFIINNSYFNWLDNNSLNISVNLSSKLQYDEAMGFKSGTTMVSTADFTSNTDDSTTERKRRKWVSIFLTIDNVQFMISVDLRDVAQKVDASYPTSLNIYCQFKYLDGCKGSQCQTSFQQKCQSQISNHQECSFEIHFLNGEFIQCLSYLNHITPNCREYKYTSGVYFLKTDWNKKD